MIVYNLTIQPEWSTVAPWSVWLKEEHIPRVLATGLFDHFHAYRLLELPDEMGPTFSIQFFTPTRENFHRYKSEFLELHQREIFEKWKDQCIIFSTSMQELD
jgi:hypothetical protein